MTRYRLLTALLQVSVLLWLVNAPALAERGEVPREVVERVEVWTNTLDFADGQLEQEAVSDAVLGQMTERLGGVLDEALEVRSLFAEQLRQPRSELDTLGPPPEDEAFPESEEIAAQRESIIQRIAVLEGVIKQAELTINRTEDLLRRIGQLQRQRLEEQLLRRGLSVLTPWVLPEAGRELGEMLRHFAAAPGRSLAEFDLANRGAMAAVWLVLAAAVAFALNGPLRRWLLARYGRQAQDSDPSYTRRVGAAVVELLCHGILPSLALLLPVVVVVQQQIAAGLFADMVLGAAAACVFFWVGSATIMAVLAPRAPVWRLLPVNPAKVGTLTTRLCALVAVIGIALGLNVAMQRFEPFGVAFDAAADTLVDSVLALLMLSLLPLRLWQEPQAAAQQEPARPSVRMTWRVLRMLLAAVLLAAPFAMLAGYTQLGDFVIARLVVSGVLIAVLLLLRQLLQEVMEYALVRYAQAGDGVGQADDATGGVAQSSRRFWFGVVLDVVIAVPALYIMLIYWGVPRASMDLWLSDLLDGVEIGELTVAPGDIIWAILIFTVVLIATGAFKRALNDKILPRTSLDIGVKNSLTTAAGYLGIALAITLAIAAIGVDAGSLALIFGALSVGIGFGLQHVVNNFVSGLILLFQRPIKAGDWIVVGNHQGYVKRINVIATEIETFDNASVILPNSSLVSSDVMNWTHKSKIGRVIVPVGVSYNSDPDQVRDILLACAEANPDILPKPAPYVVFQDFGSSSLDFELRFYIREIDYYLTTASAMRFQIKKAFDAAGIEIPFPQQDLHLRDAPALEALVQADRTGLAQPEDLARQPRRMASGGASARTAAVREVDSDAID